MAMLTKLILGAALVTAGGAGLWASHGPDEETSTAAAVTAPAANIDTAPASAVSAAVVDGAQAASAQAATIDFKVVDIKNTTGQLVAVLYNPSTKKRFPDKPGIKTASAKISGASQTMQFSVPPGRYAIYVFHDENSDGELETNWLGMPKEGVGASMHKKGIPKYDGCEFEAPADGISMTIGLKYL